MVVINQTTGIRPNRILRVILVILVAGLILQFGYTYRLKQSTGLLQISTIEPSATIAISQPNKSAEFLGHGQAKIRVAPGTYVVSANLAGRTVTQSVTVQKKSTKMATIDVNKSVNIVPSLDNIGFVNFDVLQNYGLTDGQIFNLKTLFFDFNQATKVVAVDSSSLFVAGHGVDSDDSNFNITFTVAVDSVSYQALLQYNGQNTVILTLSSNGQVVFNQQEPAIVPDN